MEGKKLPKTNAWVSFLLVNPNSTPNAGANRLKCLTPNSLHPLPKFFALKHRVGRRSLKHYQTKSHPNVIRRIFKFSILPILFAMLSPFDDAIIEWTMPSGKTHDAITILLSVPVFAFAWKISNDLSVATTAVTGFSFGGLLFGPDLDAASKQYYRWGIFRFLWYPYQVFFKHRSRWSHGLLFGTLFRIVYFTGTLTLFSFILAYAVAVYREKDLPRLLEFIKSWSMLIDFIQTNFGENVLFVFFLGIWLGAASHTLTDIVISYVKTGKIKKVL